MSYTGELDVIHCGSRFYYL